MRKCAGIFAFFFLLLFARSLDAQDTIIVKSDSVLAKDTIKHSPRKATIMSALLPGLGQIYNRKYWKVPVIYAALAVDGYFFISNRNNYVDYWRAYKDRTDTLSSTVDPYVGIYDNDQLMQMKNYWRKYMEMSVIIGAAIYLINIVDAAVDAHLYDFDVSDDLSMNIRPAVFYTGMRTQSMAPGLSLTLRFKK
ncbi:MAG: DUF5683 domain-containing protein [Bacteroidota bacterium]